MGVENMQKNAQATEQGQDLAHPMDKAVAKQGDLLSQEDQVSLARKTYKVEYPNLYAVPGFHKDADKFNCIQRAHQNTLESLTHVLVATFATGLVYPITAAAAGTVYMLGRFVYGYGYAMGDPKYRTPGGILSHLGDMPLMGMAIKIAYNTATDSGAKALVGL